MNRKTQKQLFFLFFFLSLGFSVVLTPFATAQTTDIPEQLPTITADWLSVTINDPNPNDEFRYNKGGKDLYDAVNLGKTEEIGEGEYRYIYRAKFGFEFSGYTSCDMYDIFPKINTDSKQKYKFLTYKEFSWDLSGVKLQKWENYYTTFDHVRLGNWEVPSLRGYDQRWPITLSVDPGFYEWDGEVVNGVPIESTDFHYKIKEVSVADTVHGQTEDYEDKQEIKAPGEDEWVDINVNNIGDDVDTTAYDYVADKDLGARLTSRETITKVQSDWDSGALNHQYDNNEFGAFTFKEPMKLSPKCTLTRWSVYNRKIDLLEVNRDLNWHSISNVEEVESPEIGYVNEKVHVNNYYQTKHYEVIIEFVCDTKYEQYEQYESELGQPLFEQGEFLWGNFDRGGTTGLTFTAEEPTWVQIVKAAIDNFFGMFDDILDSILSGLMPIIILIAIVIGVYLFIRLGVPLLRRKIKEKR